MKQQLFILAIFTGLLLSSCGNGSNKTEIALSSDLDSLSYAVGVNLGQQLTNSPQNFNLAIVSQAMNDVKEGKAKMSDQEAFIYAQMYQQRKMQEQMQQNTSPEAQKKFEENKAAGEKFLEENKGKSGVVVLPSGLQYKVEKKGNGPKPKASDMVEVHYKGTLIDGREFDSSYSRNETATFPLTGVIKGWTEGLQHINEGSKVIFYIPQELAYGANPRPGGLIEPYMALVFEIELIKVMPQE